MMKLEKDTVGKYLKVFDEKKENTRDY